MGKLLFAVLSAILLFAHASFGQKMPADAPFLVPVDDVFTIAGRGTVVSGTVERGTIKNGDTVELVGIRPAKTTTISLLGKAGQPLAQAKAGESVSMILKATEKAEVERGQVIAKPGSIEAVSKITVTLDLTPIADGGRSRPLPDNYRGLVMLRTGGFSGAFTLSPASAGINAGTRGTHVTIAFEVPTPIEKGQTFTLKEYGKTIGTGTVTEIIE